MQAELVVVPDAATLKEEFREVWAWDTNRNAAEALRVLQDRYGDYDIPLPSHSAVRNWISRERWHDWADKMLEETYPARYRRLREGYFILQELIQRRQIEMFTGGRQMTKSESEQATHLQKAWGAGTYGHEAGGEVTLQFDVAAEDDSTMSLEQRARRVRDRMVEANTG